jgi:DNA-binding NarL/FixJ family response regulator
MGDRSSTPDWSVGWAALDDGLADLRGCRDADDLADRACQIALSCCGADRVVLGRVRDGVWSPWRAASADHDLAPLMPPVPTALEDLPAEREVVRTGQAVVRIEPGRGRRGMSGPGARDEVVVAGVRSSAEIVGLLHVATARGAQQAVVEAFAAALSSMFALVDVRDRVRAQREVLGALAGQVATLRQDDPIELLPARSPADGAGPTMPASSTTSVSRAPLTERQSEVLELLLSGCSNAQIAERLVIAVPTVKSHVRAVLRAVGAVNRAEAVARFSRGPTATLPSS